MRPIIAIASTTVGEAIRRRVLLIILFIAVAFILFAPGLSVLSARQEMTVLKSMILGLVQLSSAIIAIVLTVYMLPNEVERRTIYTILSKPVNRWQFIVGKYLGAVAALGMMMGLMTIAIVGVLAWRSQGQTSELVEIAKAPAMYFIQMSLLAAVGIFFSTFVAPIVNFFLTGGVYLMGSLFSSFFQTLAQNPNVPDIAKRGAQLVNFIIPNFSTYSVQNPIINPNAVIQNETTYLLQSTVYGVVYITILLIGAILVFDRKEV